MKHGFVFPFGEARTAAHYAQEAERAGWDGFFVWEPVWGHDAWVTLGACAMLTETIRLGTLLTPPSRRRPWKLASETATLDRLSNGRVILSVGLGAVHTNSGWDEFGEVTDKRARAERMDEALAILQGLWKGQPFAFEGKHFHVKAYQDGTFGPPPPLPSVQQPRIPIWVVGAVNREKSLQRVVKYDGFLPTLVAEHGNTSPEEGASFTPQQLRRAVDWILERREITMPLDVVIEAQTPGDNQKRAREILSPWQDAGATWHIESMWDAMDDPEGNVLKRIQQGPPK